ncbi:N-acetyltransferase, partial [Bacteroides xylanisolvens]
MYNLKFPNYVAPEAVIGAETIIEEGTIILKGAIIGSQCKIHRHIFVDEGVKIGDKVKIQDSVMIPRGVTIEDGVFIGPSVAFTNDKYPRAINKDGTLKSGGDWQVSETILKYGSSIGANAT